MRLTLDFETRSACDLKKRGAWVYSEDPTTGILCCAVKEDDQAPRIWVPAWVAEALPFDEDLPLLSDFELFQLIEGADEIECHNAAFERALWQNVGAPKYGWPAVPVAKLRCSLAKCSYHTLPRALATAGPAIGLDVKKDTEGARIMLRMCKPRRPKKYERDAWAAAGYTLLDDGVAFYNREEDEAFRLWHELPEDLVRLCRYCMQDVEAERALSAALPDLPPAELRLWQLDQEINARGIQADTATARRMVAEIEAHAVKLLDETARLTNFAVKSPKQVAESLAWLARQGVTLPNMQKATIAEALDRPGLPAAARRFLELRQALALSSVAKYDAVIARAGKDGRIRGTLMYHGASTGRWSGAGIQPQNLPRGAFKDVETCLASLETGGFDLVEMLFGDPMVAASTCIRSMLTASPGNRLIVADFSSIEARVLAWLAGEETVLQAFRSGKDLYIVAASGIFNVSYEGILARVEKKDPEAKNQRQVGKTSELALGYQGGVLAYASMARNYGIDLETLPPHVLPLAPVDVLEKAGERADAVLTQTPGAMSREAAMACDVIKQLWRAKRPSICQLWYDLERAAINAVNCQGEVFECANGKVKFKSDGRFLYCKLPNGRKLHYYAPRLSVKKTPWGAQKSLVTHMGLNSIRNIWERSHLYGGKIAENIVQAISRDLMAEAMLRLEAAGYPIVLTVHDEVIGDVPEGRGSLADFEARMAEVPRWAAGCPIGAEGWEGKRYRK